MGYSVKIGADGSLPLPDDLRRELGLREGDTVRIESDGRVLHITAPDDVVRRFQATVRAIVPDGVSLVDELIAERRAEAMRE